jgi:hypothetical protein
MAVNSINRRTTIAPRRLTAFGNPKRQRGTPLSRQVTISPDSAWGPSLRHLLIFEAVLTGSAIKPYDGLPVRRETLANPTDWKSVVQ